MTQFHLPLPEIAVDNFERGWEKFSPGYRYEGTGRAEMHIPVLPALLRRNLVDYFLEISEEGKASLEKLKTAVAERAGLSTDPSRLLGSS